MLGSLVAGIVRFCCGNSRWVAVVAIVLGIAAAFYAMHNFAMTTNSEQLISSQVPWRVRQAEFDREYPQRNNLILVVVNGATPERAEDGASRLAAALAPNKRLFDSVRRLDGGTFFEKEGLLFMPVDQLKSTLNDLIKAQPLLGALAADPSLRGIMSSFSTALLGVERGDTKLDQLQRPMSALNQTLNAALNGRQKFLSWSTLVSGRKPTTVELEHFIAVQPKLNYGSLTPGSHAARGIRHVAAMLHLTPANGVQVRLTGPVQLQDEEFATLAQRAVLIVCVMFAAVLLMLWLAVQSWRMIMCILVTLFTGLAMTAAIGLALTGAFNIISVAFIVLFVGIGVDFGIQFCVRYRGERHAYGDLGTAIVNTGRHIGTPLALAAAATAAGFFSFLPTDYVGVAELGEVAGIGMLVAFFLNITMLPALLKVVGPRREYEEVGFTLLAPIDDRLERNRRGILLIIAIVAVGSLAAVPFVRFDFDPLHLRSPRVESVSTLLGLMKDPDTSPNTIDVLTHSPAEAAAVSERLSKVPQVGRVLTVDSYIPKDQAEKLPLIRDAQSLLDASLDPFMVAPAPSDADVQTSLRSTAAGLRKAAGSTTSPAADVARQLAGTLTKVADAPKSVRDRAAAALVPDIKVMLAQTRTALSAKPVTRKSLPPDMVRDWIAPDGTERVEVSPKSTANDNKTLEQFSAAVKKVAPNATGTPIEIQASGRTIVWAFAEAGLWSVLAITVLLALALRSWRDVLLSLAALLLTGLATLGTCVVIGLQLNYANIIALPLLLGIGVAFNIYFVAAWRDGVQHFLQTTLARAVLFSALTTASSFGSLWLSTHPGTASMGELLMISLGWTLVTVLLFLPAMLGPPREGPIDV
jgi:hypothetical protein